jgi:predicted DCC family thiol-disulfide oxidoreductase YuxK
MAGASSLVLFDSGCGLCCASVRFIAGRDPAGRFRFAALGSEAAGDALERHGLGRDANTLVLEEGGRAYTHSTAVLRVMRRLTGLWPLLYGFILVPRPVRDFAYSVVARNRHRLFGATCALPDAPERFVG